MTTEVNESPANESSAPAPVPVSQGTVQVWRSMIDQVPDAGLDGMDGILAQLAEADHPTQLDEPWRTGSLGELANRPLVIQGIAKMPAEFDGPIPFFLVVHGHATDTGEAFTATTGALSVVAQLVRAYALDAFPWSVVLRIADRPSAAGYFPQHLEVRRS